MDPVLRLMLKQYGHIFEAFVQDKPVDASYARGLLEGMAHAAHALELECAARAALIAEEGANFVEGDMAIALGVMSRKSLATRLFPTEDEKSLRAEALELMQA